MPLALGLTPKNQLTIALARLRERGDRKAMGEGSAEGDGREQPLTPGFAVPSPLGEGCYQVRRSRESKMSRLQSQSYALSQPGLSRRSRMECKNSSRRATVCASQRPCGSQGRRGEVMGRTPLSLKSISLVGI